MQHLLLRYTQALLTQMAQTAVCNRHHSVDQQLCRWLLLSLDRLPSNDLTMTQELIANMLGVRREGVTEAAGKLQNAGLDRLQPRRSPCWIGPGWRRGSASATRWSRRSSIACSRRITFINPVGRARSHSSIFLLLHTTVPDRRILRASITRVRQGSCRLNPA